MQALNGLPPQPTLKPGQPPSQPTVILKLSLTLVSSESTSLLSLTAAPSPLPTAMQLITMVTTAGALVSAGPRALEPLLMPTSTRLSSLTHWTCSKLNGTTPPTLSTCTLLNLPTPQQLPSQPPIQQLSPMALKILSLNGGLLQAKLLMASK